MKDDAGAPEPSFKNLTFDASDPLAVPLRPAPPRGSLGYEAIRAVVVAITWICRWKIKGAVPAERKFVAIAVPHTSNWDFLLMFAASLGLRVRLRWIGKSQIFRPPFGVIMRALGGIPVDRSASKNLVGQMVQRFDEADDLALAMSPEGTRGKVTAWKTGFYHIAVQAGVPIVICFLDYGTKTAGIAHIVYPTGDYDADMAPVRAFCDGIRGKNDG